ncbi:MAG TPA: amino acid adenylation domain-containing protein, partial [Polyangiales bacterium]|nr:amino acid adenylation domain-containing protein [Polyangiales bacterium]
MSTRVSEAKADGVHRELSRVWSADATRGLEEACRRERVTLNTLVQGAWVLLLQRYTSQRRVAFGATVAGRRAEVAGSEAQLGLFINTVPVIAGPGSSERVGAWLRALQSENALLREHEHTPLSEIQRWSGRAGQELFDTLLVFENYPVDRVLRERSGGELRFGDVSSVDETNFALTLEVSVEEGLKLAYAYTEGLLSRAEVERIAEQVDELLKWLARSGELAVGGANLLSDVTRAEVLALSRGTLGDVQLEPLQTSFEVQASRTPNRVAVEFGAHRLRYEELNARANQLAHYLRGRGVGADVLVGICVERSVELVVGVLGILKAGGAYVPLDPEYPRERLSYMVSDSGAQLVLTQERLLGELGSGSWATWCLDRDWEEAGRESESNPSLQSGVDHLAYCIYTSGSTGLPKGVLNGHRGIQNRLQWLQSEFALTSEDKVLQKTPLSFDVSVGELLWPLLNGATLVLAAPGVHRDPAELGAAIRAHGVTVVDFVPALLGAFVESGELSRSGTLRLVTVGGDSLPPELARAFMSSGTRAELCNMYGPTEASIDVSWWRCARSASDERIPLGFPMWNTGLHVLDASLQPVPAGVLGELYIEGANLARGYHGRAGLTAERFIPNPYGSRGSRLYRTGDLARRRADGVLEYVGRVDHQVKIRGYRIELGEVESALCEHADVRESVVLARETGQGKQLVGYVTSALMGEARDRLEGELRARVSERLPSYMVPWRVLVLESFPLSANGKLERKLLPAPEAQEAGYEEPSNALEALLSEVWGEVLGVGRVSVTSNFFELGGDSILSLQVVSRARKRGVEVAPRQLFQHQTVRALSSVARWSSALSAEQGPVTGGVSLTPIQARFFEEEISHRAHFNQALMLRAREKLDAARLAESLSLLEAHHDGLRLRYRETSAGHWEQAYGEAARAAVLWQRAVSSEEALALACEEAQRSLDLSAGPLLRAALLELWDGTQRLLLVIHHLVVDGVSWRVLLEDLSSAYQSLTAGREVVLPAKTTSFQAWASRLESHVATGALDAEVAFWSS